MGGSSISCQPAEQGHKAQTPEMQQALTSLLLTDFANRHSRAGRRTALTQWSYGNISPAIATGPSAFPRLVSVQREYIMGGTSNKEQNNEADDHPVSD